MSDELKPCPFCGGPAHLVIDDEFCRLRCSQCGATGGPADAIREDDAIAAWNRRHSPAPADAGLLATLTRDAAQLRCEHVNEHIAEDLEKVAAAITRLTTELAEARAERDEANARWEQIAAAAAHFKSRLNARENETPKPFWVLEYDHRYIVNAECNLSLNIASAAQFVTRAKADAWRRSLPHPYWGSSVVEHVFVAKESALACAAEKEADDQCARRVEVMRELNETRARLAAAGMHERGRCLNIALNYKLIAYTRWSDKKHWDAAQITAGEIYDAIRGRPAEPEGDGK